MDLFLHGVVSVAVMACAALIIWRCLHVLKAMDRKARTQPYWAWLGFGLSYAFLCCAALAAAFELLQGRGSLADLLFLVSSAGLIAFDRRRAREPGSRRPPSYPLGSL